MDELYEFLTEVFTPLLAREISEASLDLAGCGSLLDYIKTEEKMSKNLLTKFRKFWRTLSPMEQSRLWNIMTALRGNDGGGDAVKLRTTARIRGLLLGTKLQNTMIGFFKSNPIEDQTRSNVELFHDSGIHFQNHIGAALKDLKPYVKKEKFKDLLRFM